MADGGGSRVLFEGDRIIKGATCSPHGFMDANPVPKRSPH